MIDEVENLARHRATALFGAAHANVQPHAGASANLAAYQALLQPGATVLAMRLDHGGHLTHGSPASIVSKFWRFISYGVTPATHDEDDPGEVIDFDQVAHLAKAEKPDLIVAGSTAYARVIDPRPFREIADSVGALFMFDAAHPAGLIAGGVHPSPVGVADVVTLTTHKTLRGPRGGAILCGEELAKRIDSAVFPGLQGGPLEHVIAAKAVAFAEAARPSSATIPPGWWRTPGRSPARWPATGSDSSRGEPTTTCCSSTSGRSTPSSTARWRRRCSTVPASR